MVGESSKSKMVGKSAIPLDIDGHDLPPSPAPSSPRNGRKYALMTELVYTESTDQYNASSVPIYQVRRLLLSYMPSLYLGTKYADMPSRQPSSRSRPLAAAASTTTHVPAILHEPTLKDISPRS